MSYDFYSPFMSATIITADGDRVPLWMANAQNSGSPAGAAPVDRPYLQELTVKLNLGGAPVITARLTPTYEQGIEYLDNDYFDWGTARLEVVLGYSTGSNGESVIGPPFGGLLLRPEIQIGNEIQVTLNAQGVGSFDLHTGAANNVLRGKRYEIIEEILRGLDPANPRRVTLDTGAVAASDDVEIRTAMFDDFLTVAMGNRTAWQVVYQLVWEVRCLMYFRGDTLFVFPRSYAIMQRPKYTFTCFHHDGGTTGPDTPYMPILSASTPTLGVFLAADRHGLTNSNIRSDTRQVQHIDGTPQAVGTARTGQGTGNQANSQQAPGPAPDAATTGNGLEVIPAEDAPGLRERQVQTLRAEADSRAVGTTGLKLELETLGVPDLFPGDTIRVYGLGRRIDSRGSFLVMTVTHTLGTSGFTSKIEAIANADALNEQQRQQAFGPVNRHGAMTSEELQRFTRDVETSLNNIERSRPLGPLGDLGSTAATGATTGISGPDQQTLVRDLRGL